MKWMIASDIHDSACYCRKLLEAYNKEEANRLVLLGDILYHGPRNDLPKEYNPKQVIKMLNAQKQDIICVRGNCDTEVDQMAFPLKDIDKLTDIRIERNKRNYRKQKQHMEVMRAIQNVTNPNWREGNGRKSKKDIVEEWRKNNPKGKKIDCERETGLSRPTIYKWWSTM